MDVLNRGYDYYHCQHTMKNEILPIYLSNIVVEYSIAEYLYSTCKLDDVGITN